jgi:hypothetical protein
MRAKAHAEVLLAMHVGNARQCIVGVVRVLERVHEQNEAPVDVELVELMFT